MRPVESSIFPLNQARIPKKDSLRRLLLHSVAYPRLCPWGPSGQIWWAVSPTNRPLIQDCQWLTNFNIDANPDHHIGTALKLFQQAAARFKAEHNRPAVLVIDHIDIIAQQNPDLLAALQHVAEEAADKKLFKFVFVGSNRFSFGELRSQLSLVRFRNAGADTA